MIRIVPETSEDIGAREALLDRTMGPDRFLKPSERLREGRLPAEGLALVARHGAEGGDRIIGSVRLWNVSAGRNRPALLLGPLAVDPDCQGAGVGSALMRQAIDRAGAFGHDAILLVGDAPYYARFGFTADLTRRLKMPGPVLRKRLLALELVPGALAGASGKIVATGEPAMPPIALPAFEPALRRVA